MRLRSRTSALTLGTEAPRVFDEARSVGFPDLVGATSDVERTESSYRSGGRQLTQLLNARRYVHGNRYRHRSRHVRGPTAIEKGVHRNQLQRLYRGCSQVPELLLVRVSPGVR